MHSHAPRDYGRAFALGIALNLAFVAVEIVAGVASHSLALVADAGHNVSDVLGLALAWGATILARRSASARRTYGFRRMSILAALANAVLLFVATGAIGWESIRRLRDPGMVGGLTMVVVAGAGVAVNAASAMLFRRGRKRDLNLQSAFVHLAGDAVLALGVVVTGAIVALTGFTLLDPIVGLVLSITVLASTWSVLRGSIDLMLDAVPAHIDARRVRAYLESVSGVVEIHDLHIWATSTTEVALTAHLVMPATFSYPALLNDVCKELHERFEIAHATLQVEPLETSSPCKGCA
jgi:cobalt-zinc-cadmium efflux system protein